MSRSLSGFSVDALQVLYQHRLVTTGQLQRLLVPHCSSPRYVQAQMSRLIAAGLADFVTRGSSRERAWFLTQAGAASVEAAGELPQRPFRMTALKAAGPLQAHTLAVVDAGVAFVQAAAANGDECGPLSWTPEIAHRLADGTGQRIRDRVISDAVLEYTVVRGHTRSVQTFFLEIDRSTMPVSRLADKLSLYARYHAYVPGIRAGRAAGSSLRPAWATRYPRFPRLLTVLTGRPDHLLNARIRDLRAYAAASPVLSAVAHQIEAGVTTLPQLMEHGPWQPIVTPLFGDDNAPQPWLVAPRVAA